MLAMLSPRWLRGASWCFALVLLAVLCASLLVCSVAVEACGLAPEQGYRLVLRLACFLSLPRDRARKFRKQARETHETLQLQTPGQRAQHVFAAFPGIEPESSEPKRSRNSHDTTQHDTTRHDKARQDKTRPDKARQGKARKDKTRQGKTRDDTTKTKSRPSAEGAQRPSMRPARPRSGRARASAYQTSQDETRPDETRQDRTTQDKKRQDRTGPDKTSQDLLAVLASLVAFSFACNACGSRL